MSLRAPADPDVDAEATAFVRFCYARRRVGWPELYDEMCSVARRGLFQGWGPAELEQHGIGFRIEQVGRLAELVRMVVAEDPERHAVRYRAALPRTGWRAQQAATAATASERPVSESRLAPVSVS